MLSILIQSLIVSIISAKNEFCSTIPVLGQLQTLGECLPETAQVPYIIQLNAPSQRLTCNYDLILRGSNATSSKIGLNTDSFLLQNEIKAEIPPIGQIYDAKIVRDKLCTEKFICNTVSIHDAHQLYHFACNSAKPEDSGEDDNEIAESDIKRSIKESYEAHKTGEVIVNLFPTGTYSYSVMLTTDITTEVSLTIKMKGITGIHTEDIFLYYGQTNAAVPIASTVFGADVGTIDEICVRNNSKNQFRFTELVVNSANGKVYRVFGGKYLKNGQKLCMSTKNPDNANKSIIDIFCHTRVKDLVIGGEHRKQTVKQFRVRCPMGCELIESSLVAGLSIHPDYSMICPSARADGVLSAAGGILNLTIFSKPDLPQSAYDIVPGRNGMLINFGTSKLNVLAFKPEMTLPNLSVSGLGASPHVVWYVTGLPSIDDIDAQIRIINPFGELTNLGRLEQRVDNEWKAVCSKGKTDTGETYDLSIQTVNRICRDIGYSTGELLDRDCSALGVCATEAVPYINPPICDGTETSLSNCKSVSSVTSCLPEQTAVIRCTNSPVIDRIIPGSLRIVDPKGLPSLKHAGRLEFYNGSKWVSVCNDGWNTAAANIACRSMRYDGLADDSPRDDDDYCDNFLNEDYCGDFNSSARATTGVTDVVCTGDEDRFLDCKFDLNEEPFCTPKENVVIACKGNNGDPSGRGIFNKENIEEYKMLNLPTPIDLDCSSTGLTVQQIIQKKTSARIMPGYTIAVKCTQTCDALMDSAHNSKDNTNNNVLPVFSLNSSVCKSIQSLQLNKAEVTDYLMTFGFPLTKSASIIDQNQPFSMYFSNVPDSIITEDYPDKKPALYGGCSRIFLQDYERFLTQKVQGRSLAEIDVELTTINPNNDSDIDDSADKADKEDSSKNPSTDKVDKKSEDEAMPKVNHLFCNSGGSEHYFNRSSSSAISLLPYKLAAENVLNSTPESQTAVKSSNFRLEFMIRLHEMSYTETAIISGKDCDSLTLTIDKNNKICFRSSCHEISKCSDFSLKLDQFYIVLVTYLEKEKKLTMQLYHQKKDSPGGNKLMSTATLSKGVDDLLVETDRKKKLSLLFDQMRMNNAASGNSVSEFKLSQPIRMADDCFLGAYDEADLNTLHAELEYFVSYNGERFFEVSSFENIEKNFIQQCSLHKWNAKKKSLYTVDYVPCSGPCRPKNPLSSGNLNLKAKNSTVTASCFDTLSSLHAFSGKLGEQKLVLCPEDCRSILDSNVLQLGQTYLLQNLFPNNYSVCAAIELNRTSANSSEVAQIILKPGTLFRDKNNQQFYSTYSFAIDTLLDPLSIDCTTSGSFLKNRVSPGGSLYFKCPGNCKVKNPELIEKGYNINSSICGCAIHAGVISKKDGGNVLVSIGKNNDKSFHFKPHHSSLSCVEIKHKDVAIYDEYSIPIKCSSYTVDAYINFVGPSRIKLNDITVDLVEDKCFVNSNHSRINDQKSDRSNTKTHHKVFIDVHPNKLQISVNNKICYKQRLKLNSIDNIKFIGNGRIDFLHIKPKSSSNFSDEL